MISLPEGNTVWFDVDDTLVKWSPTQEEMDKHGIEIDCPGSFVMIDDELVRSANYVQKLVPHRAHIEQLKRHALRGHQIIVWSQGGALWCHVVCVALGLERYVTLCIGKPMWIYDDKDPSEFMPKSQYFVDIQ